MRSLFFADAPQQALSFMVNQASKIEAAVYRTQYPEIQYPLLVPVDSTGPDWIKSITFFSMDWVGQADWFHHMSTDMRLADISRQKFEQGVEMAAIGYRYTLEEVGQSMMMGMPLTTERASAALRAYEDFVERIAISGDTVKNWQGLINNTGVTRADVPDSAGPGGTDWASKTPDEIVTDINTALSGIYVGTNTVEMANTVLLPIAQFNYIANTRMNVALDMTILQWIQQYNVYTATTGQPLLIRAIRALDNAGNTGTDRMVVYNRSPDVVKIHIPMPHRFMPVWQTGPLTFDVPGIFRLGGTEIRRPAAVRYSDGI